MNRLLRIVLTLMLGALAAVSAEAASRSWTQLGLPGGPVRTVAVATNGRTVYAGTLAGVFKSVDGGRSWFRSSDGLRGRIVTLRGAPRHPATVYAATTEGVFASFDAAGTWQKRSRGLPASGELRDLQVAASSPSSLYALVRTRPAEPRFLDRVYRSTDAGLSWSLASAGLPSGTDPFNSVFGLAVHPARREVVLAATFRGLFRTEDGGKKWVRSGLAGCQVSQVAFDRLQPDRVYALACESDAFVHEVFVSQNGGRTWAARREDFDASGGVRVLAPDPTRAGAAYVLTTMGHLFRTTDGAVTWKAAGGVDLFPQIEDLVPDPTRPGMIYLTRSAYDPRDVSLHKSSNGGATWRPAEAGIQAPLVSALAVEPATEDVYAGLAHGGLWRWLASEGSWTPLGFENRPVWALAFDPKAPGTIYAVVDTDQSVFRSLDGGADWESLGDLTGVLAITVVDGVLWASRFSTYRWDSATSSWEAVGCDGDSRVLAGVGSGSSATLWCDSLRDIETTGADLLSYSKDGGATWSSDRITVPGQARAIAIDPKDPDRVFVARAHDSMYPGTGGVSYTNDGGKTWKHLSFPGQPDFSSVALDPLDGQHVVAATSENVFESLDGGATWRDASHGLLAGAGRLVFDPQNPGRLYAGGEGGVFALSPRED